MLFLEIFNIVSSGLFIAKTKYYDQIKFKPIL